MDGSQGRAPTMTSWEEEVYTFAFSIDTPQFSALSQLILLDLKSLVNIDGPNNTGVNSATQFGASHAQYAFGEVDESNFSLH